MGSVFNACLPAKAGVDKNQHSLIKIRLHKGGTNFFDTTPIVEGNKGGLTMPENSIYFILLKKFHVQKENLQKHVC